MVPVVICEIGCRDLVICLDVIPWGRQGLPGDRVKVPGAPDIHRTSRYSTDERESGICV